MSFLVGWDRQLINIVPRGLAMFGYGTTEHRATGVRQPLFARSIVITNGSQTTILTCLDLGCITSAMRIEAIQRLQAYDWFDPAYWMLTATHTHSGPGGCSYEALYNMPTPGFVPEHLLAIVEAIVKSVCAAQARAEPTEIRLGQARFADDIPVAWNRSIEAYNRNPDVAPRTIDETHLALDRQMQVLGFYRQGKAQALLSLFGVHATCLGNSLHQHDGDNKGYAAALTETALAEQGAITPVAIFAQAPTGDVSPHFQGRHRLRVRQKLSGEAEYDYAERNGRYQSELALASLNQSKPLQDDRLDGVYQHIDLSDITVDPQFSAGQPAYTSAPCHGVTFFEGVETDGKGIPRPLGNVLRLLARQARKQLLKPDSPTYAYYQKLFAAQGNKDILIYSGDKKILGKPLTTMLKLAPGFVDPLIGEMQRQAQSGALERSQLVPTVVPIQLLRMGELVLIGCPGEITTVAGQRLRQTVQQALAATDQVLFVSYCNDYMGYVTTYEEYQLQAYEGAHTLYGQWTLAALQTCFASLVQQLLQPAGQRPVDPLQPIRPPRGELIKRTHPASDPASIQQMQLD